MTLNSRTSVSGPDLPRGGIQYIENCEVCRFPGRVRKPRDRDGANLTTEIKRSGKEEEKKGANSKCENEVKRRVGTKPKKDCV